MTTPLAAAAAALLYSLGWLAAQAEVSMSERCEAAVVRAERRHRHRHRHRQLCQLLMLCAAIATAGCLCLCLCG